MDELIKTRIAQMRRGELPEGYKRTKAGIIPADWKEVSVKSCIREYKRISNDVLSIPVYSSSRKGLVPQWEYYDKKEASETNLGYKVVPPGYATYRHMSDDDIFHFNVNETGGEILVSVEYPVFTSSETCDLGFLIPALNETRRFRYFCRTQKLGGTRTRLYLSNLMKYRLGVPPLDEQRQIADVLSAQDNVIALKERLIAEKSRQKRYLMQQFLTGKRRLPGFDGPWKTYALRQLGALRSGAGFPEIYQGEKSGEFPFYKVSDMNANPYSRYLTEANNYINEDTLRTLHAKAIPANSIVFAKVGAAVRLERKRLLSVPSCIDNNMMAFVPADSLDARFAYYWFLNEKLSMLVNEGALPSINAGSVGELKIKTPPLAEQGAIAEILSAADREIELLRRSLELERRRKKALSQLLLTGLVRPLCL